MRWYEMYKLATLSYIFCIATKVYIAAINPQSETIAIISPSILKSKSKRIMDVCCKPEEIGHLEVAILKVAKNDVSFDKPNLTILA